MYQDRVKEVSVGRGVLVEPERVHAAPRMQYERGPVVQTVQYERAPAVQYERAPVQYERAAHVQTVQYRDERSFPSVVSYGDRERERSSYNGRQSLSSYSVGQQPASGGYVTTSYGPGQQGPSSYTYGPGQQGPSSYMPSGGNGKGKGNNVEIMS